MIISSKQVEFVAAALALSSLAGCSHHPDSRELITKTITYSEAIGIASKRNTNFESVSGYIALTSDNEKGDFLILYDPPSSSSDICPTPIQPFFVVPKRNIEEYRNLEKILKSKFNLGVEIRFSAESVIGRDRYKSPSHVPFFFDGYLKNFKIIHIGENLCFPGSVR